MICLIPADSKIYNVKNAFLELGQIDWKMDNTKFNNGDIVYIYSSKPDQ